MTNVALVLHDIWQDVRQAVAHQHFLVETALTVSAVLAGLTMSAWLKANTRLFDRYTLFRQTHIRNLAARFSGMLASFLTLIVLRLIITGFGKAGYETTFLQDGLVLCRAWLLTRIVMAVVADAFWAKLITSIVWCIAILEICNLLELTLRALDQLGFQFDNQSISLLTALQAAFALAVLLPAANLIGNFLETHIEKTSGMSPRVRVLIVKSIKVVLFVAVMLTALDIVGLNLHALTIFSGALGLGLGFGLQKVVSNLVSGIILLLDNALRPGDVIEVDGVYGWIVALNARYVSMVTRDGTSYLIPNDELISNRVINWTHNGQEVRLKIPVSVGYASDLGMVMNLMCQAALSFDRVVTHPPPVVRLLGFGDNGVNLQLRFWIKDPQQGIVNIKSDILLRIWDLFRGHGIELPFPQRDLHVRSGLEMFLQTRRRGWLGKKVSPGTRARRSPARQGTSQDKHARIGKHF